MTNPWAVYRALHVAVSVTVNYDMRWVVGEAANKAVYATPYTALERAVERAGRVAVSGAVDSIVGDRNHPFLQDFLRFADAGVGAQPA